MTKKLKILTISDNPLIYSGVGIQTRYMIEGLLKTGKYQVISIGGSDNPSSTAPIKTNEYGDDWIVIPTDMRRLKAHANAEMVRSVLATEKPDVLWIMTDPRFWEWLWMIEHEIRPHVPILYYHVWDNRPAPTFNAKYYNSNDTIITISKLTDEIVQKVSPDVTRYYLPHTVDTEIFKKYPDDEVEKREKLLFGPEGKKDKFMFFWDSQNQRRKHAGTLIFWFKAFLDIVGHDKATLIMHTDPYDVYGTNLESVIKELGLTNGEVRFSTNNKTPFEDMAYFYNVADCTLNSSDAEGFGLSLLSSLACETPIIVGMTGGLQDQVFDGEHYYGIGVFPSSSMIIGSQTIPFIYEDRYNETDYVNAMLEMYRMSKEERAELGKKCRERVLRDFSMEKYVSEWDRIMQETHEKFGSWDTRKNYNGKRLVKVL